MKKQNPSKPSRCWWPECLCADPQVCQTNAARSTRSLPVDCIVGLLIGVTVVSVFGSAAIVAGLSGKFPMVQAWLLLVLGVGE